MKCIHCENKLGLLEDRYVVRQAVKPKGAPYRWREVGYACVPCGDKGCKLSYELGETLDPLVKTNHNEPD
ncbi:MAG: hypothetical protein ACRCYD_12475 [Plesiomonas sp.]